MKYLIVSDIHGSYSSALKIRELDAKYHFEKIILLGDLNYHGPRNDLPFDYAPKKVIPLLNELSAKIIAVRGNCDAEVEEMVFHFELLSTIKEYYFFDRRAILTHGHRYEAKDFVLGEHDIFMSGHTHIPVLEKNGGIILNPGSITLPKGGHQRSYAIMSKTGIKIYTIDDEEYMSYDFKENA